MPKQERLEGIAAEIIRRQPATAGEALAAMVEALNIYRLGCLDIVPLAEAVERQTGLELVPRIP